MLADMRNFIAHVQDEIEEICHQRHISQDALAGRLGVRPTWVRNFFSMDTGIMRASQIVRIAHELGYDVKIVLTRKTK